MSTLKDHEPGSMPARRTRGVRIGDVIVPRDGQQGLTTGVRVGDPSADKLAMRQMLRVEGGYGRINANAQFVFAALRSLMLMHPHADGVFSHAEIHDAVVSDQLMSERTVQRSLDVLREHGCIAWERRSRAVPCPEFRGRIRAERIPNRYSLLVPTIRRDLRPIPVRKIRRRPHSYQIRAARGAVEAAHCNRHFGGVVPDPSTYNKDNSKVLTSENPLREGAATALEQVRDRVTERLVAAEEEKKKVAGREVQTAASVPSDGPQEPADQVAATASGDDVAIVEADVGIEKKCPEGENALYSLLALRRIAARRQAALAGRAVVSLPAPARPRDLLAERRAALHARGLAAAAAKAVAIRAAAAEIGEIVFGQRPEDG